MILTVPCKTLHVGGPDIHEHDRSNSDYPLNAVRSHLWHDIIFVNIVAQPLSLLTTPLILSTVGVNLNNRSITAVQTHRLDLPSIVTGNWRLRIIANLIICHLFIRR